MLCGQQRQPALARNASAVLRAPRCVVLHRKTNKQQGPRGSSRIYSSSGGSSDGPSSGPSGEGSVDIDQLAKLLSQRAQALRESYDEKEFKSTYQDYDAPNTSAMALPTTMLVTGSQSMAQLEAQVFKEIGQGGFDSDDFEIAQQLGRISVQQARMDSGISEPRTAVIVYVAQLTPRLPMQRTVVSLLKEYLPVARAVAYNELLVMHQLTGLPEDKHMAAQAAPNRKPPVVPLLGYFTSVPTHDAASLDPSASSSGKSKAPEDDLDSIWLVYKWEGLRPLNLFFDVGAPKARPSWFKRKQDAESEAWEARYAMLRSIARGLLQALAFCHERGVAHGSLSNGTVLLSTTDDQLADDLLVKLDNFGFGRLMKGTAPEDGASPSSLTGATSAADREAAYKADIQAAALVLAETFSYGTAVSEQGKLNRPTLQRMLFEIYTDDVYMFREYCENDPELSFEAFIQLLDERDSAGWDFLTLALKGEWSAERLLEHPFLR